MWSDIKLVFWFAVIILLMTFVLVGCVPASMSAHRLQHIRSGTHHCDH